MAASSSDELASVGTTSLVGSSSTKALVESTSSHSDELASVGTTTLIHPYLIRTEEDGVIFDMSSFSTLDEVRNASQKVIDYLLSHNEYTFRPLYNETIYKLFLNYIRENRRIPFFDYGFVFDVRFIDASIFLTLIKILKNMDEILFLQVLHVIEDDISAPLSVYNIAETLSDVLNASYTPLSLAVTMSPSYAELRDLLPIDTYTSGRPKTSMPFIENIPLMDSEADDDHNFSKVIRYGTRYGGTYYAPEREITYCGVYYYLEPESNFVLRYRSYIVARNKYMACKQLLARTVRSTLKSEDVELFDKIVEHINAFDNPTADIEYKSRLFDYTTDLSTAKFYDYMNGTTRLRTNNPLQEIDPIDGYVYESERQVRFFSEIWADEDRLDQPMCLLAQMINIDVVILTHMVGRKNYVSEIMDSRDSSTSYNNLRRLS